MAENMHPKFARDQFYINQKRMSLREKYYVYDEMGEPLFYVERPFGWFKRRNITIFDDDSKTSPVLFIEQDHFWEIAHRDYTVRDIGGEVIAKLSRNNFASLFRRKWDIMAPGGAMIATAREDSAFLAAMRRIIDLIPFVELIGGIIKTDFHFLARDIDGTETKIGAFTRRISLFDKYVLDMSEDVSKKLDRRVALAAGVLLDTAEKR